MQKLKLFLLLILIQGNISAQKLVIDASLADTVGLWEQLAVIEQKLGPLHDSIKKAIVPLEVRYWGFDKEGALDRTVLRQGLLLVHQSAKQDLKHIFKELLRDSFPIAKVIPIHKYGFNSDTTGWDDSASMEDNNTSVFNYRYITHSTRLSLHAEGLAIDINPLFNPFESYHHDGKFVEPTDAYYNKFRLGTVSDSVVVGLFDQRGWVWGGRWNNPVDFQHFEIKKERGKKHYLMKDPALKDFFQYGEENNDLAVFKNPKSKKLGQPECLVFESEAKQFLKLLDFVDLPSLDSLYKYKKAEPLTALDLKLIDYEGNLIKLQNLDSLDKSSTKSIKSDKALDGIRIVLHRFPSSLEKREQNNFIFLLEKKLRNAGAEVFVHQLASRDLNSVEFSDLMENSKLHPNLSLVFGNHLLAHTKQSVVLVPGAFRPHHLEDGPWAINYRQHFMRLLLGEDLRKSLNLGTKLLAAMQEQGIKPIDKQLPSPNFFEANCIGGEVAGLYCYPSPLLTFIKGPVVYLPVNLTGISPEKMATAYCKAILESLE